jgi:acetylglutamate synthase
MLNLSRTMDKFSLLSTSAIRFNKMSWEVEKKVNFNINRSIDENLKVYEYIRVNPDKLSESVTKVCKRGEKLSTIKYGSYPERD